MILHKADIIRIKEVLDRFPDVNTFDLEQTGNSGIGSITTMTIKHKINGIPGSFDVEISGVENW